MNEQKCDTGLTANCFTNPPPNQEKKDQMVYESLYISDIETALCVTLDNPDLSRISKK